MTANTQFQRAVYGDKMMFPIFLKLGGDLNKEEGARRRMRRRKGQGRTPGHFWFGIQVVASELEKGGTAQHIRTCWSARSYQLVSWLLLDSPIKCNLAREVHAHSQNSEMMLATFQKSMTAKWWQVVSSLVPRPHPLMRRNSLVNKVKFLRVYSKCFVSVSSKIQNEPAQYTWIEILLLVLTTFGIKPKKQLCSPDHFSLRDTHRLGTKLSSLANLPSLIPRPHTLWENGVWAQDLLQPCWKKVAIFPDLCHL